MRFDGATTLGLTLTGLVGTPEVIAGKIHDAIQEAIDDLVSSEIPRRIDELRQIACRWDAAQKRFVITSGRRGLVQAAERSSVEVLSSADSIADILELRDAQAVDGRLHYHELPVPRAMLVDVRADFWADSQAHIASLADSAHRLYPGRGSLVTQPALLARDLVDGTSEIRLLPEGEPVKRSSMALLDANDSPDPWAPRDRVTNRPFTIEGSTTPTPGRIDLAAEATLALAISPTPPIPSPFDAPQPAPRGMAVSIGVSFDADDFTAASLTLPQTLHLLSLDLGSKTVLGLDAEVKVIEIPGPDATLVEVVAVDIVGTSTFTGPADITSPAETRCRVFADRFENGAVVHASVDASTGAIELYVDGVLVPPLPLPYPQPIRATGTFAAGYDMTLTVGHAGNPITMGVHHAHLFSEPLGAFDPRLRTTLTPAGRFAPGMRVRVAETEDGVRPGTRRMETTIVAVDAGNGRLTVSPAIVGSWPRARTLLFGEEYFVQQASVRRRDDLLNNLYRFTVDYRVSALLDDQTTLAPQPAVETAEIEVDAIGTNMPLARAPGVSADIA
ncbi:Hypothetical protein A7982_01050 [Minicystis rosea]|nr:Hypothetical protein A7982_01050 [Minicystis rosea]